MARNASTAPTQKAATRSSDFNNNRAIDNFEHLFLDISQPMWVFDLKTYRFLRVNPAAIKDYGYSKQEFLKMTILDIRPPEDINAAIKYAETKLDLSNDNWQISKRLWRHILKNGKIIWVETRNRIFNYKGQLASITIVHDVTEKTILKEQRRLKQPRRKTRFNSYNNAMVLLGANNSIIDVNKCFETLFGFDRKTVLGKQLENFIVPQHLFHEAQLSWELIRQHGHIFRETVRLRKNGSLINVSISGYPIMAQCGMVGVYMIYRDLTERTNE